MDPLRTHRVILCERLDVGKVIPYLRQDRMLTADEYDTLTNTIYSVKARRNKLLDMMPRKGRNYFEHFGKNLVWSGQKELAKHIGVNVDKVPQPPPYKLEPEPDPVDTYKQFLGLIGTSGSPNVSNAHPYNPNFPAGVAAPPMQGTAAGYPPAPPMQGSAAGHLPSHGVLPLPNPQLQPLEPLPQEAPALPPILGDSKVFILYCKDDSIPNVEADDWSQTVFTLAELLGQCGRIKCTIDYYEKQAQGNWDAWTVKRIKESNFVVLVMSPLMARGLCHPSHQSLPMERGLFYLDSISALATSPHFVPVFLDDCIPPSRNLRDWLPPRLTMGSVLHLHNFSVFVNGNTDNSGDSEEEESTRFYRYIQESLQDPRFASVTSLIRHLRGEYESPPQPVASVTLPRSQPQASHVEFPYVVEAEYISHEDLDKIASKVHREWQHLGIKLGLTMTDGLRDIHYKHRSDPVKATRAMLHTWQKVKKKEATRRALKKALIEQNMGRLANELFPDVLI